MALWMCLVDFGVQNTCLALTWLWKDLESDQSNHPWSDWGRNGEVHHKHEGFINNLLGFKLVCHSLVQVFRLTAWFVVDMSTYFLKVISQLLTGGKKNYHCKGLIKIQDQLEKLNDWGLWGFFGRISGWWLTYPSEKYDFVSWGYYSQYMQK